MFRSQVVVLLLLGTFEISFECVEAAPVGLLTASAPACVAGVTGTTGVRSLFCICLLRSSLRGYCFFGLLLLLLLPRQVLSDCLATSIRINKEKRINILRQLWWVFAGTFLGKHIWKTELHSCNFEAQQPPCEWQQSYPNGTILDFSFFFDFHPFCANMHQITIATHATPLVRIYLIC